MKRALDADRDGKPEEIRYFDAKSGVIIRKEQDQDYDGVLDTFATYEKRRARGPPDRPEQQQEDRSLGDLRARAS